MRRLDRVAGWQLFALAFVIRAAAAAATEFVQPFPAYYLADARLMHEAALSLVDAFSRGDAPSFTGSTGQRVYALVVAVLYRSLGAAPIWPKLLNAALGAGAVAMFWRAADSVAGRRAAAVSALLVALWPTHVFYTAQLFKDGIVLCGAGALLYGACALLRDDRALGGAAAVVVGSALASVGRPYVAVTSWAVLAVTAAVFFSRERRWAGRLLGATALAGGLVWLLHLGLDRALLVAPEARHDPTHHAELVPSTFDDATGRRVRPFSPAGLARFRALRQQADQQWAAARQGRRVATQLFPGVSFDGWLDVAAFLPKAAFYVLFMPLPGLFPIDGLGRALAAAENAALVFIALAALPGAWRLRRRPAAVLLALFFAAMLLGSALLEFDLGSATRHKILYVPVLLLLAAARVFREDDKPSL